MNQLGFTEAEWEHLLAVPKYAVMAILLSDKVDAVSLLKEARAAIEVLLDEQQRQESPSETVRSVLSSLQLADDQEPLTGEALVLQKEFRLLGELQQFDNAGAALKAAQTHLKHAAEILAARVSLMEADHFRSWVLDMAERVAAAVKEGGFLGIGGERISNDELNMLERLAQALELKGQ